VKGCGILLAVIAVCCVQQTRAQTVYSSCAVPTAFPTSYGSVFYVDPVKGSMAGDGSQAHPWHTFSEVVLDGLISTTPAHWNPITKQNVPANPNAPVQPGDTVYLLGGNHGTVTLQGAFGASLMGFDNSDFITVAALPGTPSGQPPVISQLIIKGAGKWMFSGLTFQGVNTTGIYSNAVNNLPDYYLVSITGPNHDIILANNTFMSTPDTSKWSIADWQMKRASGVQDVGGTCFSVINNNFTNVGFGIQTQNAQKVLILNNAINYFTNDGIDYGSSFLSILNNTITNSVEDGDGFHRDGMQGQPYTEQTVVSYVNILNNVIIRITDPNLKFPAYMQGIDDFDGIYKNINIMGNIVITDTWQGISYYGASNIRIVSNIVLGDGDRVLPCANLQLASCQTQSVIYDTSAVPGVNISMSKSDAASSNVMVYGNIASGLGIVPSTVALTFRNNLCVPAAKSTCSMGYPINGAMVWASKPGTYVDTNGSMSNVVSAYTASQLFVAFDPVGLNYNFNLATQNPGSH
jgi:hypothetical protein